MPMTIQPDSDKMGSGKSNEVSTKGVDTTNHSNSDDVLSDKHKTFVLLNKYIGDVFRYLVPLAISVCLILWLFNKVDF